MLLKNSLIFICGEVLSKAAPLFFLPYLTQTLGVEGFGELMFCLAIIQGVSVFVGFSCHSAISRYYFRYGVRSLSVPLMASIIWSLLASFLFLVISHVFFDYVYAWLLVLSALGNSIFACAMGILQCQRRVHFYVFVQLINVASSILFTLVFFEVLGYELEYRLYVISAVPLIAGVVTLFLSGIPFRLRNRAKHLKFGFKYLIVYCSPLVVHTVCNLIRFEFDKLFLKNILSGGEYGVYTLGVRLGAVVQLVLLAANKAYQPYVFQSIKEGDKLESVVGIKVLGVAWGVCLIVPLVVLLVPESWILYFFGSDFSGVKNVLLVSSFGFALLAPYLLFSNVAFFFGWTKLITLAATASVAVYFLVFFILLSFENFYLFPLALAASSLCLACVVSFGVICKLRQS